MKHTHSLHQVWLMSFPSCLCFTGEEWLGRVRPAMSLTRTTRAPSTHGSLSATSTPLLWRRPTSRSSSPSTARSWAVRCTRVTLSSSTSVKGTHGRLWEARTPGSSQDSRWVSSFLLYWSCARQNCSFCSALPDWQTFTGARFAWGGSRVRLIWLCDSWTCKVFFSVLTVGGRDEHCATCHCGGVEVKLTLFWVLL